MSLYRIPRSQNANELLYRELTGEYRATYALTPLKHPKSNLYQLDVINAWRRIIESAFEDPAESDMPCWHGHYDQFGIIMLYLIERATEYEDKSLDDEWFEDIKHFSAILSDYILPSGTGERIYYRAWLSLIGHPDFVHYPVSRDRIDAPNICSLHWLMGAALTRISERSLS